MKQVPFCAIILCWLLSPAGIASLIAQEPQDPLALIEAKLKSFDYDAVIELSQQLLEEAAVLPSGQQVEVLRMRTIAFYSLGDMKQALNAYLEIMRIDPAFRFDPLKTSPKIIGFFEDINANFLQENPPTTPPDSSQLLPGGTPPALSEDLRTPLTAGTVTRSLLLPGWGHWQRGARLKGGILAFLGAGTLAGSMYYLAYTRTLEKRYLSRNDPGEIEPAYQDYNAAYQKRNALLAGYALVWIYSQLDLLYFSRMDLQEKSAVRLQPYLLPHQYVALGMIIRF